jgi:hypothetical protein
MRGRILLVLILVASLAVADAPKRLYMKDGSYQRVTKYETKGDRVRYYSAERYQWEEVPNDMVDWPATQNYEKRLTQAEQAEAEAEKKNNEAISEEDAQAPEVGESLRLPKAGGVFALDQLRGKPELIELTQNPTQNVQHTASYVLKKKINPLASRSETLELSGSHAKPRIYALRPAFYLNVDTDSDDSDTPSRKKAVTRRRESSDAYRFRLVKLKEKKDSRVLATLKTDAAGDSSTDIDVIPTASEVMPGDLWIKFEPAKDLPSGEYAIVLLVSEGNIAQYVWDFSINAAEDKGK